jgi:hypothetical protein
MACAGSGARGEELRERDWSNWAGNQRHRPPLTCRPSTLRELVAIVTRAEADRQRVKAVGSSMSYTEAAVSSNVGVLVETTGLQRLLNGRSPTSTNNIVPFALNAAARARADRLVHVEGGIKLHALNCLLEARGLSMPTLGGAFTQSIVGAISTGTHGSDIDRPPIADAVQAIHLVGPGGREWWIERGGTRTITDPARMEQLRSTGFLCADVQLSYDDRTFNAVLVSLGRMGLIYSVVIESVPFYRLRETRQPMQWSAVEGVLRTPGLAPPVLQLANVPGEPRPARFVDIALTPFFNSTGDRDAVIARRWETDQPPTQGPEPESFFSMLCRQEDIGRVLGPMIPLVNVAMLAVWGFLLAIPIAGPFLFAAATTTWVALMNAMTSVAVGSAGANLAQVLARIASLAASVGQSWIVRDLVSMMIGTMRGPLPGGFVIADGFRLMTGQRGCPDERTEPLCMRQIDGLEFAFNAGGGQFRYLDFINAVSALLNELLNRQQPAGAGLSIRFTRGSEALLAMQQFPMTVTVEIFTLRGLPGSDEFLRRVQSLAAAHGGIPHWGLIHDLTETEVARLYGDNHTVWRRVLARLIEEGAGRAETFSTNFSVRRGLEPLPGCVLPASVGRIIIDVLLALARRRR